MTDGACSSGRRRFTSEHAARNSIRNTRASWRAGAYVCRDCGGWHLTNRDKSRGMTGRRRDIDQEDE